MEAHTTPVLTTQVAIEMAQVSDCLRLHLTVSKIQQSSEGRARPRWNPALGPLECADCPRLLPTLGGCSCLLCNHQTCLYCTAWVFGESRDRTVCWNCVVAYRRLPDEQSRVAWFTTLLDNLTGSLDNLSYLRYWFGEDF